MEERVYNVMVVEDHAETRELLQTILEGDGEFRAVVAGDGGDAVRRMQTCPVDMFLVDLTMPGMNGYDLIKEIRGNPSYKTAPVTVLTANDDPDERVRALDMGATDFLAKPFHVRELLARLRNQARQRALQQALSEESRRDPLTELPNRRRFDEMLAEAFRQSRRGGRFAVAMVDVDYFKSLNDRLGHPFADAALRGLAKVLRDAVRDTDSVARIGGDEFALLLRDADIAFSRNFTDRVLSRVRAARFEDGVQRASVTVSLGIAFFPDPRIDSVDSLLRAADEALYAAKALGRDRAVLWGEGEAADGPGVLEGRIADLQAVAARVADEVSEQFIGRMATEVAKLEMRAGRPFDHAETVRAYAEALARAAGLDDRQAALLGRAALLRDCGLAGIAPALLAKGEAMTDEERRVYEEHPALSAAILRPARFLVDLLPVIRHHHERWDGAGYPDRLSGEQIPLGARILAIADAAAAASSAEEAAERLRTGAGADFDPVLVTNFLVMLDTWTASDALRNKFA